MANFIDRRLNSKNKSTVNRQRFLRRYKNQIKKSVSDAINQRGVTDIDSGESIVERGKMILLFQFQRKNTLTFFLKI